MPRGSLEVVEFAPQQAAADATPAMHTPESDGFWGRLRPSRTLTSCLAAAASLALHALFVAPALWGGGKPPDHSQDKRYAGDTALQWIVLDDSPATSAVTPSSLGAPGLVTISVADILPTLPSATPAADTPKDKAAQPEDDSSLGVMYGRYVGQIQARIDRAWRRPRTAIGAPLFQCQVQIDQDAAGRVGDVTLLQCNGSTRWRLSLVQAVEAASPLPAPPNQALFTRHVLLQFRAMAYSAGAQAELYEPPAVQLANARQEEGGQRQEEGGQQSQNAIEALREGARAPHSHRIIELRIEGSKVEVWPEHQ